MHKMKRNKGQWKPDERNKVPNRIIQKKKTCK